MRPKLYATVEKQTLVVLHNIMEENKCNRSEAIDFLANYYEKRRRVDQLDEVADRVLERLKKRKKRY
ncbi:hypothetical protein [Methanosalsum natronophilum]|uniref:hypothetical protein n=1 Tax=Methanosalsum natronophilum TaxID=768733 RepID=UPI002168B34B|nr:hypothetical protein [Methanosalsum natronophilum]MCS3923868.1 hypothetical protein [Methanosalsum natronophilum]